MTLAAGLLLATLHGAAAKGVRAFYDGHELYAACTNSRPYLRGVCQGFVAGVADVLGGGAVEGYSACIPLPVMVHQAADVVVAFLRDNPGRRHFAAMGLAAEALSRAFPCQR